MKPFTGLTRLFRPDLTARVAHTTFVVLKGISSSVRYNSTLDNSRPPPKLESPDTADSSKHTIVANANASDQRCGKRAPKWTPEECRRLKDALAKGMTTKAIKALFPTRTLLAIGSQRAKVLRDEDLGSKTPSSKYQLWSPDEIKKLKKLHSEGLQASFQLCAHFPDRSNASIKAAMATHTSAAHERPNSGSLWSHEDDQRLIELAQSMSKRAAAEAMGRSAASINTRASILGVAFISNFKEYTAEEIAVIIQMRRDKVPYRRIAAILGRNVNSVVGVHYKHRPLEDGDAKVQKFLHHGRLSLEELESVRTLRARDVPWPEIGRQFPMHDLDLIVGDYRRFTGYRFSSNEMREIESLRAQGRSWRELSDSNHFYYNNKEGLKAAYRRTAEWQKGQQ